jgi:ribose transport system ATP-binding protein
MTSAGDHRDLQPVLQMRGISKRYPGARALDNASLEVRAGEVHVVLGENGAGKSTLMKILSGAVRADSGEILLDGRPVDLSSPLRARTLGISTIYQELSLVPHLSVAENIFLGKTPTRWAGVVDLGQMRSDARRILDGLGVAIDCDAPVHSLRLAQQQMVEVGRALSDDARLLVMDEPTSALSQREVGELFTTIARLTSKGVAVVYISHRMDEVFHIGHRVTVLRDGTHVATRNIADVTAAELVRLMANREVAEHYPRRQHAVGEELLRVDRMHGGGLEDISFVLRRGEILGIAGLVGAGRTRLARALVGADPVADRRIVMRGTAIRIDSPADAVRAGIGFLPEDRKQQGLVLRLSVERNMSLSHLGALARFGVLNRLKERGEAEASVASLRIRTPGPDQLVLNLSGGNQQKVVLAKWLAAHAEVLIFDEPTRGIDVAARQEIYLLMNRLVENGAALIMISSDLPEVLGMSDRILVMRRGRVVRELAAHEATDAKVLQAALGVAS